MKLVFNDRNTQQVLGVFQLFLYKIENSRAKGLTLVQCLDVSQLYLSKMCKLYIVVSQHMPCFYIDCLDCLACANEPFSAGAQIIHGRPITPHITQECYSHKQKKNDQNCVCSDDGGESFMKQSVNKC